MSLAAEARVSSGARDRIDFVEDSRMHNVVSLQPDRPRPQRALGVPRNGARILFFTGVRYCRDEAEAPSRPDGFAARHGLGSEGMLDAAAH